MENLQRKQEDTMFDIRLDDGMIHFEGKWLSNQDLSRMIQEKIQAGDMKFAKLAKALEELNNALENSVMIETRLVLTKEEHEKLRSIGGKDDLECIRKAITASIEGTGVVQSAAGPERPEDTAALKPEEKKKVFVKCTRCKTPIEVSSEERPIEIKCPKCGAFGRLKA